MIYSIKVFRCVMILETNLRKDNYSPLHVPELQIIPSSPEHGGFTPHLHLFEAQVSDNPVHS